MNRIFSKLAVLALASSFAAPALAQDQSEGTSTDSVSTESVGTPGEGEVNNGTNPVVLANTFEMYGKYTRIGNGLHAWELQPSLTLPFGSAKMMSLTGTLPFTENPLNRSLDLGDASVKLTHILDLNRSRGIAYTAEFYMDTASAGRGYGEVALEVTGYYVMFLKGGWIMAPSLQHTQGLGNPTPADGTEDSATELYISQGGNSYGVASADAGKSVSTTTFDLYLVPKLKDPKLFMTIDPAWAYDWRAKDTFGSLQVTFGRSLGELFGGNFAVYVKPQLLIGKERPANWGMQVGMKLIGF